MLKMRLQRIGRKNDPSFRVVVTDSHNGPKAGNHVDIIGSYNPKMNTIQIDGEAAKKWISQGVQVSDTVHNLLVSEKVIEGTKKNVLPKKSPIVSDTPQEEAPAAPAEEAAEIEAPETTDEESTEEAPVTEAPAEETPEEKEEVEEEPKAEAEAPAEEAPATEETPVEEEKPEAEETTEETPAEEEKEEAEDAEEKEDK